jgi:predicted nucleic acid-binding protein
MTALLDTDVLIDCLRGMPEARSWLAENAAEEFQIPGVVAMELIVGCQNRPDLRRTMDFLSRFTISWPESGESALGFELLCKYHLASALGIPDCLIAAMGLSRSARLYTFNLKHFRVVEGLDVREPYSRS